MIEQQVASHQSTVRCFIYEVWNRIHSLFGYQNKHGFRDSAPSTPVIGASLEKAYERRFYSLIYLKENLMFQQPLLQSKII